MAEIQNRSTKVFNTVTAEFRSGLKGLPKKPVPAFGEELSKRGSTSTNPTIQFLKDRGVPLDSLKRL